MRSPPLGFKSKGSVRKYVSARNAPRNFAFIRSRFALSAASWPLRQLINIHRESAQDIVYEKELLRRVGAPPQFDATIRSIPLLKINSGEITVASAEDQCRIRGIARVGSEKRWWGPHRPREAGPAAGCKKPRCEEESQGIHTALSHLANAENVSE